jgi:hypothetical protein
MKLFFLVFARDEKNVYSKIRELKILRLPFLILCGVHLKHVPNVIYHEAKGKYDAINYGMGLIPRDVDIIALNDADTKICNFEEGLNHFILGNDALQYARVSVKEGPQKFFYPMLDAIRRKLPIAASGELMLVRRRVLDNIMPLKPCKAEDSYILFKFLELKKNVAFYDRCYVVTERTKSAEMEEEYKRRTVCGLYQALSYCKPSIFVKLFYYVLPLISPILLVFGKNGYYWMKGILRGLADHLQGDQEGRWLETPK